MIWRSSAFGPNRHFHNRDRLLREVIDDGLTGIHEMGMGLLEESDPARALEVWLDAYIEQGSVFKGLAETLVNSAAEPDGSDACHRAREAGAALIASGVRAGVFRPDVEAVDVLDVAAAIVWVGEQPGRPAGQRVRLFALLVDGIRVKRLT